MVYVADATELDELPAAEAIAFNVSDLDTEIGPLYTVELVLGVDPSVV
jgi:hypothetical protein